MKKNVLIAVFVLLFVSLGANLAADGSSYFKTVNIVDTPCYVVPEAVDDMLASDDSVFYLPVGIYKGYEAIFELLAGVCKTTDGLTKNAVNSINNIVYDIYLNDDYVSACLNDADARRVDILWERATYYWGDDDEDMLKPIYDCLPDWAGEMYDAVWQITYLLHDEYELSLGISEWDDFRDLAKHYKQDDDFTTAIEFINTYFPKIDFNLF